MAQIHQAEDKAIWCGGFTCSCNIFLSMIDVCKCNRGAVGKNFLQLEMGLWIPVKSRSVFTRVRSCIFWLILIVVVVLGGEQRPTILCRLRTKTSINEADHQFNTTSYS